MDAIEIKEWDSAQCLQTNEDMLHYLRACLENGPEDAVLFIKALKNVARAKGLSELAIDTDLGQKSLDQALSGDSEPSFFTVTKVMQVLGFRFHVEPARR